jgi:hypothetical protein
MDYEFIGFIDLLKYFLDRIVMARKWIFGVWAVYLRKC